MREVKVDVEIVRLTLILIRRILSICQPSSKVAILRFERGMQQGLLARISRSSIMEYHAFGIISLGRKSACHYMICGVQGDFTKDLVANPPKTVWTRELKFGESPLYSYDLQHIVASPHLFSLNANADDHHTNFSQPASATPQQCSPVASAFVPVLA